MKAKAIFMIAGLVGSSRCSPDRRHRRKPPTVEPFNFNSSVPSRPTSVDRRHGGDPRLRGERERRPGLDQINAYHFADTFTNPATGKRVEYVSGRVFKNIFVDNGRRHHLLYILVQRRRADPAVERAADRRELRGHTEGVDHFRYHDRRCDQLPCLLLGWPPADHHRPAQYADRSWRLSPEAVP